jgi:hypothetical protein
MQLVCRKLLVALEPLNIASDDCDLSDIEE